jgi:hypothetical protein
VRSPTARRPLWKCPKCGHEFVTANLWHSCGTHSLDEHFVGKAPHLREVFDKYVALVRSFGPTTVYAQKTRIVFQVRVRFGGAAVRKNWVEGRIWLKRKATHRLVHRTESYGRLGYGLYFRLTSIADLDDPALAKLLREAYAIGCQETTPG